jgi:hypothetical protein
MLASLVCLPSVIASDQSPEMTLVQDLIAIRSDSAQMLAGNLSHDDKTALGYIIVSCTRISEKLAGLDIMTTMRGFSSSISKSDEGIKLWKSIVREAIDQELSTLNMAITYIHNAVVREKLNNTVEKLHKAQVLL